MRSKKSLPVEQVSLLWDSPGLIAGVDEAGRGPLAGPVVAAAVILDELKPIRGLADSKKLSPRRREALFIRAPGPSTSELRDIASRHRGALTGSTGEAAGGGATPGPISQAE